MDHSLAKGALKVPGAPFVSLRNSGVLCKTACASGILEVAVYFKVLRPFSIFPALATGRLFTTGLGGENRRSPEAALRWIRPLGIGFRKRLAVGLDTTDLQIRHYLIHFSEQ